ncbi:MAG: class E sortase [Actinobacteria bacterium]|nr:class E sortase [Actinomycetota bacterium]
MSTGDKVRFVLRGIGQTLITFGLVVLLFVVYEVWITNIFADRNNRHNISALEKEWAQGKDPLLPLPDGKDPTVPIGNGIGILYMPRLGADYHEAIIQGDATPNENQLEQGAPHYGDTQLPGEVGNFAIAGHRVGKGEPFLNLDHLRSGDAVIVETKSYWYVYRVLGTPAGGDPQQDQKEQVATTSGGAPVLLPGREVVDPDDGAVLLPVPDNPGVTPTTALMTMTTCTPKFTASSRMIVYAKLAQKVPSTGDTMPASIKALYNEVNA